MKIKLELKYEDGRQDRQWYELPLSIGRFPANTLQIKSWRVAKEHALFLQKDGQLFVQDFGSLGGTVLNNQRIYHLNPLAIHDQVIIGPCLIQLLQIQNVPTPDEMMETNAYGSIISERVVLSESTSGESTASYMHCNSAGNSSSSIALSGIDSSQKQLTTNFSSDNSIKTVGDDACHQFADSNYIDDDSPLEFGVVKENFADTQAQLSLRKRLHTQLLEALDLRRNNISQMHETALRADAQRLLKKIVSEDDELKDYPQAEQLCQMVLDEAVGLGPLETLLKNKNISEIMVNRYDEIYIEQAGRIQRYPMSFSSEQAVLGVIDRIVAPIGRRIDEGSPMVDARLSDGSRVNAVIPPVSLKGVSLTIRKFPERRPQMQDLIKLGSMDELMCKFLEQCVRWRMNIIVSGGTGSGKTTLLNILSNCIPPSERIVTIEDAAELRLNHEHLVSLEARPANTEGRGQITIRDLVRNALRMRPDRIVVGECRGGEAFDMLSAMNTGHEGSLTTLHANTPRDALSRLEVMILMAGMELPLTAIREHVCASIDFIVQQSRLSDGRRVISSIVEVCGMESGIIKIQEIFKFERKGRGLFKGLGIIPECFERFREQGFPIDPQWFTVTTDLSAAIPLQSQQSNVLQ